MKYFTFFSQLFFCFFSIGSFAEEAMMSDFQGLERSEKLFAIHLLQNIESEGENSVISPYSVWSALSSVYFGACGKTEEEIRGVCFFPEAGQDILLPKVNRLSKLLLPQFRSVSGLAVNKNFQIQTNFLVGIEQGLGAKVFPVDFEKDPIRGISIVNNWVSDQTNGKITELLSKNDVSNRTQLILLNACRFKGAWLQPFDKKSTKEDLFHTKGIKTYPCQMMQMLGHFPYLNDEHNQLIELDFAPVEGQKTRFSLLCILPHIGMGRKDSFQHITVERLQTLREAMKNEPIELFFPKFTTSFKKDLKIVLENMGMKESFSSEADFSRIDEKKQLRIGKVLHEAKIELDEVGVEAEATTAVTMMTKSFREDRASKIVRFDRPFFCLLIEKTEGIILFGIGIDHPQ